MVGDEIRENVTLRRSVTLTCHPSSPCPLVRRIEAQVDRRRETIAFAFRLDADLGRLRIPAAAAPRRGDRLWQHTCFEVFIAARDSPAYHELNFAPSGEWAAYAFRGYRDLARVEDESLAPAITTHADGKTLEVAARVVLERLAAPLANAPLRLGLSAVVEDGAGALSYWALRHRPGKPDFHHHDAYVLSL